jgi:phosphoserine phosphatase RsbU/P
VKVRRTPDAGERAWNAALAELMRRCRDAQPDELPGLINDCCSALGVTITLYLVDLEQRRLWPVPENGRPTPRSLPLDGTPAGHAVTSNSTRHTVDRDGNVRLWVPLTNGADQVGLAEVVVRAAADRLDRLRHNVETTAALLGQLVNGKMAYGDLMHRTRRTRPMHPSGELLLSMVPPLNFRCRRLVITTILEPCYDVGGDAFDYAVDGPTANFMILDSMGRGMQAALTSAAVLAATRAARREGRDLHEMAGAADDVLAEQFGNLRFATGVLARLDTFTGRLRYLNAGHPAPILIRRGEPVRTLYEGRRLPMGVSDNPIFIGREQLQPGDRLLLYTDGITDPRDREDPASGASWLADAARRSLGARVAAPEALRRLSQAVVPGPGNRKVDDATLMLVEWAPQ